MIKGNFIVQFMKNRDTILRLLEKHPGRHHVTDWPSRAPRPLATNTAGLFCCAFPALFCYGTGSFYDNHEKDVKLSEWIKHMMALGDGRFAGHPLFRHVAVDLLNLNRNSTISHIFLKESFGDTHVTNEQLVAEVTKEKSKILDKLMIFAGEERGSKEFLYQRAIEMESLMYYKVYKGEGGPSAFITMSKAEFWDPFLHQLLKDYVKQTQGVDIDFSNPKVMVQCVSMYPHVIVHYFDYRVQSFMKLVLQKFHGVTDYYFRYEFSPGRGAIHLHGFIWIVTWKTHKCLS